MNSSATLQFQQYALLMRLNRPIGILLLLWPTYWALWLAADGLPSLGNFVIFTLGVLLMRSAGCVINDYADRDFDGHVKRTKDRPLATGKVSTQEALILFAALCMTAFLLVLFTNAFTIALSFGGLVLASLYPFMKRYTYLPQVVLGAAFAWAVPMAFTAETNQLPDLVWLIYTATLLWTVAYDTQYAMVDRDDDLKIGIKSTAILFGELDKLAIACLQTLVIIVLLVIGDQAKLSMFYYVGLTGAASLFIYQQHLIRTRDRDRCFQAFLNNNYVGLSIFLGLALDLSF